jgi:uncharacterized protein with NRDE domain
VCLLIALFQVVPSAPLIVAANRDERYDRPAVAITTLRQAQPRVLGGRDEVAGGTWLAVNESGVVAGLTNLPAPQGRDPAKRSRGELPLALAAHPDAASAVAWICACVDPSDYNPCWLLVGDRESLFYVDLTGGLRPAARPLPAGSYVLENAPLLPQSPKAGHVAGLITMARSTGVSSAGVSLAGGSSAGVSSAGVSSAGNGDVRGALAVVLRDHSAVPGSNGPAGPSAACVHGNGYGTRSAMIVTVGTTGPPQVQVADGPSCQAPLVDVGERWAG